MVSKPSSMRSSHETIMAKLGRSSTCKARNYRLG